VGLQRILAVRHVESTWNEQGLWQGQADPPVSALGALQLRDKIPRIAKENRELAFVASSDLERAASTAQALARASGVALWLSRDFRERDAGAWSGMARREIEESQDPALLALRAGDLQARPPGGESGSEVLSRFRRGLRDAGRASAGGPFAVVTHLGALRVLVPGFVLGNAMAHWLEGELTDHVTRLRAAEGPAVAEESP
jgi:probable phosphoglycerate mutase